MPKKTILFACIHNAGRSQMAAAFLTQLANPERVHALSAGTQPAGQVHPEVVAAMREVGVDLSGTRPQKLTEELAAQATHLITMGCGDECPYVPGLQRDDWALADPKGKDIEQVRALRDEIKQRVEELIARENLR